MKIFKNVKNMFLINILVNHKQPVCHKTIAKSKKYHKLEYLHQIVPIPGMPQAYQMTSHPTIPVQHQYPFVQHNPLVNLLQDISGRNRTVQADR